MNEVQITVRGNAASEVALRQTSGGPVAEFRLASTSTYRDKETGKYKDGATSWFSVKAWGKLAVNVSESIHQGSPVLVRGRLNCATWENEEGQTVKVNELVADALGIELHYGTAKYFKRVDLDSLKNTQLDVDGEFEILAPENQVTAGTEQQILVADI